MTAIATPALQLEWLCDLDEERARAVLGRYTTVRATAAYEQVLADPAVSAVAIATDALVERARNVAADLLEAAPEDVVLDVDGLFVRSNRLCGKKCWRIRLMPMLGKSIRDCAKMIGMTPP